MGDVDLPGADGSTVHCRCFVEPVLDTAPQSPVADSPAREAEKADPLVPGGRMEDLDRCLHGRHSLDPCWNCPGGQSTGNEFLRQGQRIGTNLYGEPIMAVVNRRTA